jgi:hypothetical protein
MLEILPERHSGPSNRRAIIRWQDGEWWLAARCILDHIADPCLVLLNNCRRWLPFENPAEWTAQVLAFLRGH